MRLEAYGDLLDDIVNRSARGVLFRALVLDDEEDFIEQVKPGLEAEGLVVDAAKSIAQARRLLDSQEYDLVIIDIFLPADPEGHGDRFILTYRSLVGKAEIIPVTQMQIETVEYAAELDRAGTQVIPKGEFWPVVKEKIEELRARKIHAISEALYRVNESVRKALASPDLPGFDMKGLERDLPLALRVLPHLQDLFVRAIEDMQDQSSRSFCFLGRTFSATEVISEVKEGTSVGAEFLKMFIESLLYEPPQRRDEKHDG